MANSRKKISELPALNVATLDTTFVLGISGSTTYKISINNLTSSLDTTFATDLVTNALSSSLNGKLSTSSFNSYTASAINGTISGSSQLTSSFDQRYVISGSITQTTWDNIASKPGGIVSSSIQISDLGFVTGSYTTINSFNSLTQSFNSISQSFNVISGSVVSIQGGFDTGSYQTFTSSVNTSISNLNTFTASQSTSSLVNRLNTIESVSGSWITESETGSFLTSLSGAISSSSQLTSSYDTRYTLSGSIPNIPTGSFATTGSNTFIGEQIISSSLIVTNEIKGIGNIFLQPDVNDARYFQIYNTAAPSGNDIHFKGNTDFNYFGDDTNYLKIDDSAQTITITGVNGVFVSSSLNVTDSINGTINATNGVISGSAQITTLGFVSGSYLTSLSGAISSSSQLTTAFPSKTTGAWSVPAGASTQSFTVEAGASYTMWVNGNIPNGIITWNATVTTSNTNVPVVGSQYGWYYTAGNALVLTAMPDQIIGTTNTLISSPTSYAPNTSNVFKFGITNNSGTTQTINYGYIKLS